jgi:hypothetical protein
LHSKKISTHIKSYADRVDRHKLDSAYLVSMDVERAMGEVWVRCQKNSVPQDFRSPETLALINLCRRLHLREGVGHVSVLLCRLDDFLVPRDFFFVEIYGHLAPSQMSLACDAEHGSVLFDVIFNSTVLIPSADPHAHVRSSSHTDYVVSTVRLFRYSS